MKVKGWQIVVIVLGLLVGGVLVGYSVFGAGDGDLADSMYLVDVETGSLYQYSITSGRSLILPARRMDTKQIALVRITREADGSWVVSQRDLASLGGLDQGISTKAIDVESGRLLTSPGTPAKYSPPMPK